MTPAETNRINRLLGLIAIVTGLSAIALPGESAARTRKVTVTVASSAEEAGDTLTAEPLPQPAVDSTEAIPRIDSGRVGRAPFYGGSPIPLVQPAPPAKHRRRATPQTATSDSIADTTKAESSMEGLVCFQ